MYDLCDVTKNHTAGKNSTVDDLKIYMSEYQSGLSHRSIDILKIPVQWLSYYFRSKRFSTFFSSNVT